MENYFHSKHCQYYTQQRLVPRALPLLSLVALSNWPAVEVFKLRKFEILGETF